MKNKKLLIQKNLINNVWIDADSKETLDVKNPYDDSVIAKVPLCGKKEAIRAVEAAEKAFPAWRALSALERSNLLRKWADLIEQNLDDLTTLMTWEHGKPLGESKGELIFGINIVRWCAEEARRVYGTIIPSNLSHHRILALKQPIGVVGLITPWNFPMATVVRKAAAALAAGCTVVVKPAELTPLSALAIGELSLEAGFPPGIFNLVAGNPIEIGQVLTTHPSVRGFSFTGSTAVGKLLQKQCADTVKKVSLELGGNSPLVVFPDADLKLAVKGAMATKFRNMGQTCVCANRIYVHDSIFNSFLEAIVKAAQSLTLGNGVQPGVTQGPLIEEKAVAKIERLIADATKKGAKIICGGKRSKLGGTFFEPTVMVDANDKMDLFEEEIFGPVAVLYKFHDEKEVIQKSNHTRYGLASYVFTHDLERAFRMMEAIEAGVVSINEGVFTTEVAPFGGFKESGYGREGGHEGISEFLDIKQVCLGNMGGLA